MIGNLRVAFSAAVFGVLAVGSFAQIARADIIFDQYGAPETAFDSDFEAGSGFFQQADDFHLDFGANSITDIHWWGAYSFGNDPTEPDNFTIRIFENDAGLPAGDPIFELIAGDVGRADTGIDLFDRLDMYAYSVDIPALTLEADKTYWLSIINDTAADLNDTWLWAAQFGGTSAIWGLGGELWREFVVSQSFQLTNDALLEVPEPATMALFGAGLVGLGLIARKKKAA